MMNHTSTEITTMSAFVQSAYGTSADNGAVRQLPVPTPGEREVLVRVAAAGVDRGTWHLMTGLPLLVRLATGLRRPRHPVIGRDLAGTVVAVGSQVTRFSPGDRVFGIGSGAFAGYAVAPEVKLLRMPASLGFAEAAATPTSGITAWQALHKLGRVSAGQRVLIMGASGGVGTFAAQIAVAAGAEVTAVCSAAKVDLVRSLGAHQVCDYQKDNLSSFDHQFDLIVDIGGRTTIGRLRKLATSMGTIVFVGGEGGDAITGGFGRQFLGAALSPFVRQRLTNLIAGEQHTDLEPLLTLIKEGKVRPVLDRLFSLEEVPAAVDYVGAGRARGKVVIEMTASSP